MLPAPCDVDLEMARTFLVKRFGSGVDDVTYVGEGAWSRCFGFRRDDEQLVVRFGRHVDDFQRDQRAAGYAGPDLPVPQVLEIGEAFDAWFAVSTRAHGTPWEQLSADKWEATLPSIWSTLDALRDADISDTTGFGAWDTDGNARCESWQAVLAGVADDPPGRLGGWRAALAASPVGFATFDRGYERMMEFASDIGDDVPHLRSLVHNDLLNRNALAAGGQVTALFDWGCSFYGDFVHELATMVFWSPWHPALIATDLVGTARAHYNAIDLDVDRFDDRLRCCALHIGLEHLGYNAVTDDLSNLRLTEQRTASFLR